MIFDIVPMKSNRIEVLVLNKKSRRSQWQYRQFVLDNIEKARKIKYHLCARSVGKACPVCEAVE